MTPLRFITIVLGLALCSGQIAGAAANDPSPKTENTGKKAQLERVQADFKAISAALLTYRLNAGQFPTVAQGLTALIQKPKAPPVPEKWIQIAAKYPVDPWGFPYGYDVRSKDGKDRHFLISKGPDQDSDKDDIEFEVKAPEPAEKK